MNSKEASRGARALGFQSAASSGAGNCRERFERTAIQTTLNLASITQAILVADHLSFRRAARILGIRQSGISRRVSELESQIGVALFERHASGIRITNAGTLFLQQARDALQQLDCAAKIAASAGTGTLGHLNVGILSSISSDRLRLLVEDYHARHPDIFIHFFEASSSDHVLSVLKRALDVAFISDRRLSNDCEKLSMWA
jgi:DNA-binding transcriptional LysR family regulator